MPALLLSGLKELKWYPEILGGKPCDREVQFSCDKKELRLSHISTVSFSRTCGHILDPLESRGLLRISMGNWFAALNHVAEGDQFKGVLDCKELKIALLSQNTMAPLSHTASMMRPKT